MPSTNRTGQAPSTPQQNRSQSFIGWLLGCTQAIQGGLLKVSLIWLLIGSVLTVLYQHG